MPRKQGYWKQYYQNNKDKYKRYYHPEYIYTLTLNGETYIFKQKQDIKIERKKYTSIKNNPTWKSTF